MINWAPLVRGRPHRQWLPMTLYRWFGYNRLIYGIMRFEGPPNTPFEYGDPQLSSVRPTFLRHLLRVGEFLITPISTLGD